MATPLAVDTRRPRAVVPMLLRGLSAVASLSFGKVLIGVALLWMAATLISGLAGSDSTQPNSAGEPAVELVAYDDQNSDTVDESDWSFSFSGGEQKPAPVNNSGSRRVGLDGHMAAMATATPARSLAELRTRYQPAATETVATEPAVWPFGGGHTVATNSGQQNRDQQSGGYESVATRPVVANPSQTVSSVLEFVGKMIDKIAGAAASSSSGNGEPADEPRHLGASVRTPAVAEPKRASDTAENTARRGPGTDTVADSAADSTTKFATVLFDRPAQDRTSNGSADSTAVAREITTRAVEHANHQVAPRVPEVDRAVAKRVDEELADVEQLQLWTDSTSEKRPPASPRSHAPAVKAPAAEQVDELMGGVVDLVSGIVGTVAGEQAGAHTRQTLTDVAGQVSAALAASNRLGKRGGAGTDSDEFQLAMPERTAKHSSHEGGHGVAPEHDQQPITCLALGCPEPDSGLSGRDPGVGGGRGPPASHHTPDQYDNPNENGPASRLSKHHRSQAGDIDSFIIGTLEDTLSFVRDLIDSLPRGGAQPRPERLSQHGDLDANLSKLTNGFVPDLRKVLGNNHRGGTGQAARTPAPQQGSGQENQLAEDISELTSDFVSGLLESLGVSVGSNGSGPSGPHRPQRNNLTQNTSELTNNFISDLLELTGIGGGSNSGSDSNTGNGAGEAPTKPGKPNLDQALDHFSDLASGMVSDVAGDRAGRQIGHALAGLSEQLRSGKQRDEDSGVAEIEELADEFVSDPTDSIGAGKRGEGGEHAGGPFSEDLGYWGQLYYDAFMAEANAANEQAAGQERQQTPGVDEALGKFNDLASGLVSEVAGEDAGQQTQQALGTLFDRLRSSGAAKGGGTEHVDRDDRDVRQARLDDDRLGSIDELTTQFVADLMKSLGVPQRQGARESVSRHDDGDRSEIGESVNKFLPDLFASLGMARPRDAGAGQSAAPRQQPRSDLEAEASELTDDFVSDLLEMLGDAGGASGSGRPGGSGGPAGGTQRPEGLDEVAQLLGGVTDLVSGLVGSVAGEQAGTQARELLTAAGQDVLNALATGGRLDQGEGGGGSGWSPRNGDGVEQTDGTDQQPGCGAGASCPDVNELFAREGLPVSERAPPPSLGIDADTTGPTNPTDKVFNGRLDIAKSQQQLAAEQQQVTAGTLDPAAFQQHQQQHQALVDQINAQAQQLPEGHAVLIDEVITGHQKLTADEASLQTQREQLAAGTLDQATYDANIAAYYEQRENIYAATDELRWLTGHTGPATVEGTGAGCGLSGRFAECHSSAEDPSTGQRTEDRCMSLPGLSTCHTAVAAGQDKAAAHCDTIGCGTSSVTGGQTAAAWCTFSDGECRHVANTGEAGAEALCEVTAGCQATAHNPGELSADAATQCTAGCAQAARAQAEGVAQASIECLQYGTDCGGHGTIRTSGELTDTAASGVQRGRQTTGGAWCETQGGGCQADSDSDIFPAGPTGTDPTAAAQPGGEPNALTETSVQLLCPLGAEGCQGGGDTVTTATILGDGIDPGAAPGATGNRSTNGSSHCEATAADCQARSDSTTRPATEAGPAADGSTSTPARGPDAVSNSAADLDCDAAAGARCLGKVAANTAAADSNIDAGRPRSSTSAGDCVIDGGACRTLAQSTSSTGPEASEDPNQTSGPSSHSRIDAALDCPNGCTGVVHTSSTSTVGDTTRTSTGEARCTNTDGPCQAITASIADTNPGAARELADGDIDPARLAAGPSAASAAGGKLTCDGPRCGGSVSSAATGTDPTTSPDPGGSRGEGVCEDTTGGTCRAVTNSGAAAGPEASDIAPVMKSESTTNASIRTANTDGSSGQSAQSGDQPTAPQPGGLPTQQPAAPPVGSPGAGATGAPSVGGVSSWSTASAVLDCLGGEGSCAGNTHSAADGLTGPAILLGTGGTRGPPAPGTSHTSSSCNTTQPQCQASTHATAGSGQVVADQIQLNQKTALEQITQQADLYEQNAEEAARAAAAPTATPEARQAATEAQRAATQARQVATQATELTKQPITGAPATVSQASGNAACESGSDCAAATDARAATGNNATAASRSHTIARCESSGTGCAANSKATATTANNSGIATSDQPGAPMLPGISGAAETSVTLDCLNSCSGTITGDAVATAKLAGGAPTVGVTPTNGTAPTNGEATDPVSHSTAHGTTTCDGAEDGCQASISTGTSVAAFPGLDTAGTGRFGTTNATISGTCQAGDDTCPVNATANTVSTDDPATLGPLGTAGDHTARSVGISTCPQTGECLVSTGGYTADHTAETDATCAGTGCTTHTDSAAHFTHDTGTTEATSASDCTAGPDGQCAGTTRAGASPLGSEAAAECIATPGGSCAYSTEATANAQHSGSKANARGYGSDTAPGSVAVNAEASADPHQATAGASCTGAPNCTYTAHAEANDYLEIPAQPGVGGGYGAAWGKAACSGGGAAGGGCGANAWAVAGPDGDGGGNCSGTYSSCQRDGDNNWVDTPALPTLEEAEAVQAELEAEAAQLGRDTHAPERAAATNQPDNVLEKAQNMKDKAEQEILSGQGAEEAGQAAHDEAVARGESSSEANAAREDGRAAFNDAAAETLDNAVYPEPDITRSTDPAAAGIQAAIDRKRAAEQREALAEQLGRNESAVERGVATNQPDNVLEKAQNMEDKVPGQQAAAAEEAGEAAYNEALNRGHSPANAENARTTARGTFFAEVAKAGAIAPDVGKTARDARVPANMTVIDAPDNTRQKAYGVMETSMATGQARAGEIAYQDALSLGATPEEAEIAKTVAIYDFSTDVIAELKKPRKCTRDCWVPIHEDGVIKYDSAGNPYEEYGGEEIPGTDKIDPTTTLIDWGTHKKREFDPAIPIPGYLLNTNITTEEASTGFGRFAQVVQLDNAREQAQAEIPEVAATVWRPARVGLNGAPDNHSRGASEAYESRARQRLETAQAHAGELAAREAQLKGLPPELVEQARMVEIERYANDVANEVERSGERYFDAAAPHWTKRNAPDWMQERSTSPSLADGSAARAADILNDWKAGGAGAPSGEVLDAIDELGAAQQHAFINRSAADRVASYITGDATDFDDASKLLDPSVVDALVPDYQPGTQPTNAQYEEAEKQLSNLQDNVTTDENLWRSAQAQIAQRTARYRNLQRLAQSDGTTTPDELAMLELKQTALDRELAPLISIGTRLEQRKAELRALDIVFAEAAGDLDRANQLRNLATDLDTIYAAANQLTAAGANKQGADALTRLHGLIELEYGSVRDTFGALGTLKLPSTLRPDIAHALNYAVNRPTMDPGNIRNRELERQISRMSEQERTEYAISGMSASDIGKINKPRHIPSSSEVPAAVLDRAAGYGRERADIEEIRYWYEPARRDDPKIKNEWHSIYRIKDDDGKYIFIDMTGAEYDDLEDFNDDNLMYTEDDKITILKDLSSSAKDNLELTTLNGVYVSGATKVIQAAAPYVALGSTLLMLIPGVGQAVGGGLRVLAVTAQAAGRTAVALSFGNAANDLVNRWDHGQPTNPFTDAGARASWLSLAGSALEGAGAIVRPAANAMRGGGAVPATAGAAARARWGDRLATTGTVLNTAVAVETHLSNAQQWSQLSPLQKQDALYSFAIDLLSPVVTGAAKQIVARRAPGTGAPARTNDRAPPLGADNKCGLVMCANLAAEGTRAVNPDDLPTPTWRDQSTDLLQGKVERQVNGHTEAISRDELNQRMNELAADPGLPIGTKIPVWIKNSDGTGHGIVALKVADNEMAYLDDHGVVHELPANAAAVTLPGTGRASDVRLSDLIGPYVGARAGTSGDDTPRPSLGQLIPHISNEATTRAAFSATIAHHLGTRTYGGLRVQDAGDELHHEASQNSVPLRLAVVNPAGQRVGTINIHLERQENGQLRATYGAWHLEQEARGQGFASEFLASFEDWIARSGGGVVEARTNGIGSYFFAKHGLDWVPEGGHHAAAAVRRLKAEIRATNADIAILREGKSADEIQAVLARHHSTDPRTLLADLEQQRDLARDVLRQAKTNQFGTPGYPTPREFAEAGWLGQHGAGASWIGKRAMISTPNAPFNWVGEKRIPALDSPSGSGLASAAPDYFAKGHAARVRAVSKVSQRIGRENDPEAVRALDRAYDVAAQHSAPFITKIAHDMLPDLHADVASDPNHVIVFVGRDGHSLARATRELDPEFFDQHCTECVLSRATVESAVQDYSRHIGDPLPSLDQFRGAASKVSPKDIDGSWSRLTDYLERSGIPIQGESPSVTLVDTSYKGTVQVLLAAIYPHVQFQGRYAFFGESPHDPLPDTKQGYALHLTGDAASGGLPHREFLPADPKLTFSNKDAIATIEETLHGPLSSPNGLTAEGPHQSLQRFDSHPLVGLNPTKVDKAYVDPVVREGVKRISQEAVTDYARHVARLRNAGHDVDSLLRAAGEAYIDNVRRWITQNNVDPEFGMITDSFVRRADKDQVKDLATTLDKTGFTREQVQEIWRQFDRLRTLDEKQRFVNNIRQRHPR